MSVAKEPKRNADIDSLVDYVAVRVRALLRAMEARGFDPLLFEARRSPERQRWLYGVGRTHSLQRKPVTWTLRSKHLTGKAADIISKSRGWAHPAFFRALREESARVGLATLAVELCHVEWQG